MAFNLFGLGRKRDDSPTNENKTDVTIGDEGTLSDILLQTLINGETISVKQALSIPAVSGNVDFIAGSIASMPVRLYKRKKNEDGSYRIEEVKDDPRVDLLNNDTGDTLNGYEFKKALVEDYLLSSGGYAYIEKVGNNVTGLYYVENCYVVIDYNFQPIFKNYKIFVEDGTYRPYEFIKLLRNSKNGAWGYGIVAELNDALQTAFQTQKRVFLRVSAVSVRTRSRHSRELGATFTQIIRSPLSFLITDSTLRSRVIRPSKCN